MTKPSLFAQLIQPISAADDWFRLLFFASILGVLASACDGTPPTSAAVESVRLDPEQTAKSAAPTLKPAATANEIEAQVATLGKAHASGFEPAGPLWTGELKGRGGLSHMLMLNYGRCYRILAAGSEGISDLDIALLDSNDVERLRDQTANRYPAIGLSPELCPQHSGLHRVEIRAFKGRGRYAMQAYRSPTQL